MHEFPVCCRTSSHVLREFSSQSFCGAFTVYIHSTVRLPLIGYIFVRLANWASHLTHTNWLMILDFVTIPNVRTGWHIKVAHFCSKGSRTGGGGGGVHGLNCASGICCHWLPNARHGLVSGVIQIARFVPQNNSAKRRANNDLHCSRLFGSFTAGWRKLSRSPIVLDWAAFNWVLK